MIMIIEIGKEMGGRKRVMVLVEEEEEKA